MRIRRRDHGHLMVGLMVGVAILLILTTVAVQVWADVLRRDQEAEMIFRAQDIVRALRRYRQDHGGKLPAELKELTDPGTRGQYYIRKMWTDPLVKDGKWGLLYASPQGGLVDPNSTATPTDENEAIGGRSPVLHSDPGIKTLSGSGGGQELAGLPIAGVKSLCKKKTFRVLRDESEYSQWLFSVFDLDGQMGIGGSGPIGGGGGVPGQVGPPPGGTGQVGGGPTIPPRMPGPIGRGNR